jgi:hypothetical protein
VTVVEANGPADAVVRIAMVGLNALAQKRPPMFRGA